MRRCTALAVGLALILLGSAPPVLAQGRPPADAGAVAGRFDVGGGRRLYLECRGMGGRGAPRSSSRPAPSTPGRSGSRFPAPRRGRAGGARRGGRLYPRLRLRPPGDAAQRGRHGGASRSDPAPLPRTAQDVVADLHALLRAARVPGPYVLVGHSLGGLFVRLSAATYPDEVAGLVLVDSSHEDQFVRLRALLTPEQWATVERTALAGLELPGYPELEWLDVEASFDQVRRAGGGPPPAPPAPGRPQPGPRAGRGRGPGGVPPGGAGGAGAAVAGAPGQLGGAHAGRPPRGGHAERALRPARAAGAGDRRHPGGRRGRAPGPAGGRAGPPADRGRVRARRAGRVNTRTCGAAVLVWSTGPATRGATHEAGAPAPEPEGDPRWRAPLSAAR